MFTSKTNHSAGFSLMEVLVVITLVAVIAVTATQMLFSTLSGSGKAESLAVVKQNGDHAIGLVERAVRNARAASCPVGSALILTDEAGVDTTYAVVSSRIAATTAGDDFITSDQIVAENFSCAVILGSLGQPDVVSVSFQLRLGVPGVNRASEVAVEKFETRVSLRTY